MILILLYYMPEIIDRGASFLISLLGFDIIERESLSADEPTGFDLSLASRFLSQVFMS